ncbi:MAG: hypothetical protein M3N29_00185 [Chloroflexota bacterium]|nr:hypothetical protein [Chloroflexota bacterium]
MALFTAGFDLPGNSISTASDWVAPTVSGATIAPSSTGSAGFVRQSQSYFVYANVSDTGTGVASVTADVSNITTGETAAAMTTTGGPWTVGGASYTYRSASLASNASLPEGPRSYTVSGVDNARNTRAHSFSVTVDNSAPSAAAMIERSGGGSPGFIRHNQTYFVYANVTDAGSGVATVTADVSSINSGQTAVVLTATGGPWTVGGQSYNYRSGSLTSPSNVTEGERIYTVTASDNVANSATSTFSVIVDKTNPSVSGSVVERTAGGGAGFLRQGDTYFVYASATDALSGVASVTANVSSISTGQTAVELSAGGGPWIVNGISYSYRSLLITANPSLAEGPSSYTVTATDKTANSANASFSVTVDNTAPSVTASVIERTTGGGAGFLRQGQTYFVYANVTDARSGVASVTADVNNITTGQTAVPLSATGGPWTVNGVSYNRRSASITANASLSEGARSYLISAADNVGNTVAPSFSVIVDNTAPSTTRSLIERTTGGGAGFLRQGQTYFVYANVTDLSSGVAGVTANVSNVTTGQTAVALSAVGGPWAVSGATYNYRSGSITANASLSEGSRSYTVTATDNATNSATPSFSVTIDNTAPAVASIIARTAGGAAGFLRQADTYFVYANVTDSAAGVASVAANVSNISGGQTSASLSATGGPWSVAGVTYNHRSASLTADSPLADGAKSYTITATDNVTNTGTASFSATIDNTPPVVSRSVIERTTGGGAGFVRQGQTYFVYANVTDARSGVGSVGADVSALTTGQSAATLSATGGPWTIGGATYNYRSASITANASLPEGSTSYTVSASDNVSNASSPAPFSVTVDNTQPTISAGLVALENGQNPGYIGQGMTYRAYADASDNGVLATVTANVSSVTTGQSSVALSSVGGPWIVDGVSYSHRSAVVTANGTLSNGNYSWSVTASDQAANSRTTNFGVIVDNNATVAPASGLALSNSCVAGSGISQRATSTANSSGPGLTVSTPAGLQAGDVMIAQVVARASGTISAPEGWTAIRATELSGTVNQATFWRLAGSSEPGSYTFTTPGTARNAVGIVAYSGVHASTPINAHNAAAGIGTTATAPSVTTTVANTRLLTLFMIRQVNGSTPDGMNVLWKVASAGGAGAATADGYDQVIAASGATGSRSSSWTGSVDWIAHSIALRPASFPRVQVSWTATPSTFAGGYVLQRWLSGLLQQEWTITPLTTTVYLDDSVASGTAYTYRLRAYAGTTLVWLSTEVAGTTTTSTC